MRINRVKLYNISSYADACEFDFTVTNDKNIILIGGQNGSGKTSLFTAIKLALYGPLCFRFQSKNNQYTAKIKDLINHDAFSQKEVNAFIELNITLPKGNSVTNYVIKREWTFENQHLEEIDTVWENDQQLADENFDYFQSYLYSIIPPNLFDFFFFDGEEISNFFSSSKGSTYIKEAIYALESYDTFQLIEKFSKRFINNQKDAEQNQYSKLYKEFAELCDFLENVEILRANERENMAQAEDSLAAINEKLQLIELKFQKAGGISKKQRAQLEKDIKEWEHKKDNASIQLKHYVENLMPLILTKNVAKKLETQLSLEDRMQQYKVVQEQLTKEYISNAILDLAKKNNVMEIDTFVQELSFALTESIKPHDINLDSFTFLHNFSQEQRNSIISVLYEIQNFNNSNILAIIKEKELATAEWIRMRSIVENSIDDQELQDYLHEKNQLIQDKMSAEQTILSLQEKQTAFEDKVITSEKRVKSLKLSLAGLSRKLNVDKYTPLISDMMNELLAEFSANKRAQIEHNTLFLYKSILRKEHLIDRMELDEQLNFSLYRQQQYSYDEVSALLRNIGSDELIYRFGNEGIQILFDFFNVKSVKELKKQFKTDSNQASLFDSVLIDAYKRIEFHQLSKGEKQIFILSLYWAIIQSSSHDIPFIIDTPYARIDTEHREQIAVKMFPSISKQVIIFSTDEEITRQYYKAIESHISHEYTLDYNDTTGRTEVRIGYFTEGV